MGDHHVGMVADQLGFDDRLARRAAHDSEVDAARFESVTGVAAIVQRPPSLYVTVEDSHWNRLSVRQRREYVQQFVDVVAPVGYRGVHVRLATGASAARWLEESGLRLLEAGPS